MELQLDSGSVRLKAELASTSTGPGPHRGLVLCHGFPLGPSAPAVGDDSYAELATGLAAATGWTVLAFDFRARPRGRSVLSPVDWLTDLHAAVDYLAALDTISGVWLAGFSIGGALALCAAGDDERVQGVAAFGAPAELDDFVDEPVTIRPLQSISKIPPRPVLLVHGDADDLVPVSDARALADAAGGEVELRIVGGAGHGLRHDPRVTAVLEGWLDRQAD